MDAHARTVPVAPARRKSTRIPLSLVVALIPVAAALNIVGYYINTALKLPTFLDMIGTAVVAFTIGPWWAALCGIVTNAAIGFISNPVMLPFAACSVVGGLVWGYGVRWGLGKSYIGFFILNILVAVLTSITAVPIYLFVFGGASGHFNDIMTAVFLGMGQQLAVAVFSSNVLSSLADKVISGFVALAIVEALPSNLSSGVPLPKATGMGRIVWIAAGLVVGIAIALIGFFAMRGGA